MTPSVLVVAYGLPPNAGIGGQRTLRLLAYLAASDRWRVSALTARAESYTADTPVDMSLIERLPSNVPIVRTGVFRGLAKLGSVLSRVKKAVRGSRPVAPQTALPGAAVGRRKPRGLKGIVQELAAMPDKNLGWIAPATYAALRTWSRHHPDVIYSSGPPWSGHLVAYALSRTWGRPWVADFRDPWVRSPWTRYTTRPAFRVGSFLERMVIEHASEVVFTTETAMKEFAVHYGPQLAAKFHAVPNGCDPDDLSGLPVRDESPDAPFVILHAGSLYGERSPAPVIRAAARLCADHPPLRQRFRLRFLGDLPDAGTIALCASLGLDGIVEFPGRVRRDQSLAQMKQAGALLILQAGLTLAIPGKLYEYFAAGRPVLALCEPGEMADVITRNKLGVVVNPEDDAAIAAAMARLIDTAGTWVPAAAALFDGRVRATETAALLESALARRPVSASGRQMNERGDPVTRVAAAREVRRD